MARSPFQGTYQPNARPVVITAPDALVLINNNTQIVGCPSCNRTFDINRYITSITVDLSVDSVPGSASINLSVPRHTIDDFYFDGTPVISPMMEINIYAKGYYLVEGLPQYYPIFWGLITEVNDSYSSGEHTVAIHCSDILKWWELCRMDVNPAYTSPVPSKFNITLNGNVFSGMNPFDVIWTLAQQAWGDIVIGGGGLQTVVADSADQKPVFMPALSDIMAYWSQRFQNISKNLLLYGSSGVAVRGDVLQEEFKNPKIRGTPTSLASRTVRVANGGDSSAQLLYDPTSPEVVAFRTNNTNLSVNFWQNEFQTKLEMANTAKEAIGYEFYMDVTGDIVFKPPFYNLDILSNKPVSWIQDIDIIDWDLAESESEVVTQLTLSGNYSGNTDWGMPSEMTPFQNITDYHLLRKYGWRPHQLNSEFMGQDLPSMFRYGLDVLDKLNSKRHRGTVTIPFRPELRLGFPVYLAPKDQIWYVSGISHNLAFGSRATTSLTLTAKREKFKAPIGIGQITLTKFNQSAVKGGLKPNLTNSAFPYSGKMLSDGGSFTLKIGDAATLPADPVSMTSGDPSTNPYQPLILRDPQTGRILGYPNVVMAYVSPYAASVADFKKSAGLGNVGTREKPNKDVLQNYETNAKGLQQRLVDNAFNMVQDKHLTNRAWYGLTTAGKFIYAHDLGETNPGASSAQNVQGVIGELVLLPAGRLTTTPANTTIPKVNNATVMIRPVSDERGFEVIGHNRYGRGVSLSDGQLISNSPQDNFAAANVSIQVALTGDLAASLTAQSQGLTAIASTYPNPVNAIAQLQPDDLRTSGFITPSQDGSTGGGVAHYGNTQPTFATLPVLGSPQVTGVFASVEASQLSRGLTLAEMTVVDNQGAVDGADPTQPQCMCLLGRTDLAFINTGYQVKTLNGTTPDVTELYNPNGVVAAGVPQTQGGVSAPTAAQQQALDLIDQISTAQINLGLDQKVLDQARDSGDQARIQSAQQVLANDTKTFNDLNAQYQALQQQLLKEGSSVSTNLAALKPDQVTTIVNEFLFNLYTALDTPHTAYEQQLRGGVYVAPQPGANGSVQVGPNSALGDFAPPFSAPNRFATGDLNSLAQQVSSNANNLSQAWSSFGQNLQANAQVAGLSQQIASDQADLAQAQAQLKQAQSNPAATQDQIAGLQQQIATLEQKIATETIQLQQARAQASTQPTTPQGQSDAGPGVRITGP